jgi:hypothetical protein
MQLLLVLLYLPLENADEVIRASHSRIGSPLQQQRPFLLIESVKEPRMVLLKLILELDVLPLQFPEYILHILLDDKQTRKLCAFVLLLGLAKTILHNFYFI